MSTIEIEGFLSNEATDGVAVFRERFKDLFDLVEDANRVFVAALQTAKLADIEDSKFGVYLLAIRVVESFEAIVILMERGMLSPAKLVIRPLLEAMFSLGAIQKDESLVKKYFDTQNKAHFELLKSTTRWKDPILRALSHEHGFEKKYINKKKELNESPPEALRPYEWAEAAGYEDLYHVYYVYYASFTHSNLSALEDHLDRDIEDKVEASFGPSIQGFYDILRNATAFTLVSIMHLCSAFGIGIDANANRIHEEIRRLDEKYNLT